MIEFRSTEGQLSRAYDLAAELVQLPVDVIVTMGGASTRPAKEATARIPIVMAQDVDPVSNGFVASLARPGGNITGLSTLSPELNGKQPELLKEVAPKLSRVMVFGYSDGPATAKALKETDMVARTLGIQLQHVDVLSPKDFQTAYESKPEEPSRGDFGHIESNHLPTVRNWFSTGSGVGFR